MHTVSPNSMTASLNSPARSDGSSTRSFSSSLRRTAAFRRSPRSNVHRAATRRPFDSSATTGTPKAWLAIARAV